MDYKVLFASFALVFVAELGDKTQLAALTFTTSSRSPWMVFCGTSLALVTATALAVLLGDLLTRFLPANVMQIGSGVLFVLMGLILLVNVARKAENPAAQEAQEAAEAQARPRSVMFSLVTNQAATFEQDLVEQLETLEHELPAGHEKDTVRQIIAEDRIHMQSLEQLRETHQPELEESADVMTPEQIAHVTEHTPVLDREAIAAGEIAARIMHAVEAEQGLAEFFLALARMSKIATVRDAFRLLAAEDLRHAERLYALIATSSEGAPEGTGTDTA